MDNDAEGIVSNDSFFNTLDTLDQLDATSDVLAFLQATLCQGTEPIELPPNAQLGLGRIIQQVRDDLRRPPM